MTITLPELFDKLKEEDEVILVDKLGITSENIVDAFEELIEESFDEFSKEYDNEYEDENL